MKFAWSTIYIVTKQNVPSRRKLDSSPLPARLGLTWEAKFGVDPLLLPQPILHGTIISKGIHETITFCVLEPLLSFNVSVTVDSPKNFVQETEVFTLDLHWSFKFRTSLCLMFGNTSIQTFETLEQQ